MVPISVGEARTGDRGAHEAVVALIRYSVQLDAATAGVLGPRGAANLDVSLLLAVHASPGLHPGELAQRVGSPRSTMARGLARLVQEGLVVRRTSAVDRRNTDLVLTRRGRHRVDRLAAALEDHYRSREPLAKEVLLLLGRDPDGVSEAPATALEVAGRMSAAGARARGELESAMRPFGLGTWIDSYAVVILALHELRPSQLAHELLLTPTGTSSLLDRLEGQGLVERVPGALTADRRGVVVRATARGRRASDAFVAVLYRHMPAMVDAVALTIGRA